MRHLVRNATKFTGRGGLVTIAVSVDTRNDRAVVSVRDTGVGMEADLMPRVFDAFSQGETGIDRKPVSLPVAARNWPKLPGRLVAAPRPMLL